MKLPDAPTHWKGAEKFAWQAGYVEGRIQAVDVDKILEVLLEAEEALASCYELTYSHKENEQDRALASVQALIEELKK